MITMIAEKTCTKCGETKSTSEFHRMSSSSDGLRPNCKSCGCHAEKIRQVSHSSCNMSKNNKLPSEMSAQEAMF